MPSLNCWQTEYCCLIALRFSLLLHYAVRVAIGMLQCLYAVHPPRLCFRKKKPGCLPVLISNQARAFSPFSCRLYLSKLWLLDSRQLSCASYEHGTLWLVHCKQITDTRVYDSVFPKVRLYLSYILLDVVRTVSYRNGLIYADKCDLSWIRYWSFLCNQQMRLYLKYFTR